MKRNTKILVSAMMACGAAAWSAASPGTQTTLTQRETAHNADVAIKIGQCERGGHIADLRTGICTNNELPAIFR